MASSQSQTRAQHLERRLRELGASVSVRRANDQLTRVWVVDGRRMSTGQAERYARELEDA